MLYHPHVLFHHPTVLPAKFLSRLQSTFRIPLRVVRKILWVRLLPHGQVEIDSRILAWGGVVFAIINILLCRFLFGKHLYYTCYYPYTPMLLTILTMCSIISTGNSKLVLYSLIWLSALVNRVAKSSSCLNMNFSFIWIIRWHFWFFYFASIYFCSQKNLLNVNRFCVGVMFNDLDSC